MADSSQPRRAAVWLLAVLLLAAVVITYLNHFDNDFHFVAVEFRDTRPVEGEEPTAQGTIGFHLT